MGFAAGQTLGNYRILARIGVGGMGEVYLAEHPLIGKKVALKIIHPELSSNREVVQRFFTEARAANKIGNEHIVEIHDFGQTDDGNHFFIMEYLEGRTLADELGRLGVLPVPRVLHIGAQVASALGAAHDAGIIHRDLKPDNVMLVTKLGDPDFVKVLDFGLAKIFDGGEHQKLTAAGVVLGTPHYMSPEACESKPGVDHRTDVYSLGILLFQMLCGRLPFQGDSMGEVLVKQVAHPPPALRGINPDVPPAVEQVVLRCLAKPPAARFQTMLELRDALLDPQRYLAASPPILPTAGPDQQTILETGGAASRPRRESAGSIAKTVVAGAAAPMPAAPVPAAPAAAAPLAGALRMPAPPAMPQPAPVANQTMAIMTPPGYSSSPPPRRGLTMFLVLAGAGIVGGGAALIVGLTRDDAAPAAAAAPDAGVRRARINLSTRPSGAAVLDDKGALYGTTPVTIELPVDGREVTLTFQHPDAAPAKKTFVPGDDATFEIELGPAVAPAAADAGPTATAPTPPAAPDAGAPAPAAADAGTGTGATATTAPDPGRKPPTGKKGGKKSGKKVGNSTLEPDF